MHSCATVPHSMPGTVDCYNALTNSCQTIPHSMPATAAAATRQSRLAAYSMPEDQRLPLAPLLPLPLAPLLLGVWVLLPFVGGTAG